MPESPRILDFDICRVFHGDTLVDTLQLVRTTDARLSDARTPLAHTHVIPDVTGLQTALDGKAASSHTHALSDLTQSGAALNDVVTWNGSAWAPAAGGGGGGVSDGDKGDITVSGGGTTWTIDAQVVTFAKMQNIATDRLLGRDTAGTGSPEEISLNATLEFTGAAAIQRAALTGDVTASAGSNATTIANDAVTFAKMQNSTVASVLVGRGAGGGAGDFQEITLGTNLSMSGTTLNASGGGGGGGTWTEAEIDFGSTPKYDASFTVTDGTVSGTSKIIVLPCGKAATGRTADDWQWDGVTLAATPGTGSFTLYAVALPGPVVGPRKIQYQVA